MSSRYGHLVMILDETSADKKWCFKKNCYGLGTKKKKQVENSNHSQFRYLLGLCVGKKNSQNYWLFSRDSKFSYNSSLGSMSSNNDSSLADSSSDLCGNRFTGYGLFMPELFKIVAVFLLLVAFWRQMNTDTVKRSFKHPLALDFPQKVNLPGSHIKLQL